MVVLTATQMLTETDYTTDEIPFTTVEYFIDNAIDYVNLHAGTGISNMTGSAGSKTVTVTSNQSAVLKPVIHLMLKAYMEQGPNANVSTANITFLMNDSRYALYHPMIQEGISRLRGRSFERV